MYNSVAGQDVADRDRQQGQESAVSTGVSVHLCCMLTHEVRVPAAHSHEDQLLAPAISDPSLLLGFTSVLFLNLTL